ncbi:hypothetical protein [Mucilaginibacter gotjawali]|uniref:Tetratricopeptide repeat protein n=1 Tax=Mucilaginibacter gotjawali TaxID=1550579 RepID=A0A839SHC0_9SPHI|nr:hypothetical protein [Mucilaginibacter gotjawali]MBB3056732.1 hypothetical protein [Mucilaginibacter gotjawali]
MRTGRCQESNIQAADSISTDLYNKGSWRQLISYGSQAQANGINFPGLRLKVAFAFFITGNYKHALNEYQQLLSKDTYNETARYYAYFCCKFLNDDLQAAYHASFMDKEAVNKEGLKPYGLIAVGAESGVKQNNDVNRDNGFYERITTSNRLNWRFQLDQSLAYFSQDIFKLTNDIDNDKTSTRSADLQKEYYAKLSYSASENLSLIGSFHYLNTKFNNTIYNSNLGLIGLKYTGTYTDMQADINFGRLENKPVEQYNTKVIYYPLGNFNLYTISRASVLHLRGANNFIVSQAAGFKLIKNTWLESTVILGDEDDYFDADGLYIYNAIDKTTLRCGETVFYQLGTHAQLQISYAFEKKADTYQSIKYDQNSVTLGVLWKF